MNNELAPSASISPKQHYYAISSNSLSSLHSESNNSDTQENNTIAASLPIMLQEEREAIKKRQWALGLFSLTTVLLFADQNLMAPNLTEIAEEFGFDDEERDTKLGGHIAMAFWVLGAPAALLVGVLADRVNRSLLFALTVGIGEGVFAALRSIIRLDFLNDYFLPCLR